MKKLLVKMLILVTITSGYAQKDTVIINANSLKIKDLKLGKSTFLIYAKKGKDKPVQNQTLVEINVSKQTHDGQNAVGIEQTWYEKDTTSHTAYTLLTANDLSTIQHNFWWKRNGQKLAFDFEKKTFNFEGKMMDAQKEKLTKDFQTATESGYFLNWHCDLTFFPLLPFKEELVFKIRFYDPGFGIPKDEVYEVLKSETIEGIDCWVLNYTLPRKMGYQRFWISKKAKEVIKEEDNFNGMYRYKLKMMVSE